MGTPSHSIHYLEIVTTEAESAHQFYADAFGWDFSPAEPALGFAFVAELAGGSRCGIRGPLSPEETPIVRTYRNPRNLISIAYLIAGKLDFNTVSGLAGLPT